MKTNIVTHVSSKLKDLQPAGKILRDNEGSAMQQRLARAEICPNFKSAAFFPPNLLSSVMSATSVRCCGATLHHVAYVTCTILPFSIRRSNLFKFSLTFLRAHSAARALADSLGLLCTDNGLPTLPAASKSASALSSPSSADMLLVVSDARVEMRRPDAALGALYVDFVAGRLDWKRQHGDLKNSALVRACSLSRVPNTDIHVVDGTAGLGSDSFMLASRGFRVTAVERNPAVFALLRDGIARAQQVWTIFLSFLGSLRWNIPIIYSDNVMRSSTPRLVYQASDVVGEIARRMTAVHSDSQQYLASLADAADIAARPHIVFLDPMYPSPSNLRKQALPKKGMQYLR